MATSVKQVTLIISGGWHTPESYAKLTAGLESSDFEVHTPHLPSVGNNRPPKGDLATDTETIRNYAEKLANEGHTIVALMHSYGGHVGTNALHGLGTKARSAKGLQGGISYNKGWNQGLEMTSNYNNLLATEGTAMMDKVAEFNNMDLVPLAFDIGEDHSCLSTDFKGLLVSPTPEHDMAEIDRYIGTLTRWNAQCMYQPIEHAAWREIPASYIYTTTDITVPIDYQKSFVKAMVDAGHEVQTFELVTGHCPNVTATDGVVDVVKKVVSG